MTRDGRILIESGAYSSYEDIRARGLGVDVNTPELLQKDGLWGEERGLISTSAAIFGPAVGPRLLAVLFINSDIIDGPRDRARGILQRAYNEARVSAPGEKP